MTAQRDQPQDVLTVNFLVFMQTGEYKELGLARGRHPDTLRRGKRHPKASRNPDALIERLEARDGFLDQIADFVVISRQFQPGHFAVRQCRVSHARHDGRLRAQELGSRHQLACRGMNHRHRIFNRDRLPHAVLYIQLGAPQTREQVRFLADQKMGAIELRTDMNTQIQLVHGRETLGRIRKRHGEVAAETEQGFRVTGDHRLHCLYRIVAVFCGWFEAQYRLDFFEKAAGGFLGDADRPVALNIGVPAQRTNTRARLANVAAQQQQVTDQPDVRSAFVVLGDTHAIGHDGGIGLGIGGSYFLHVRLEQSAGKFDSRPFSGQQIRFECLEAIGVLLNEFVVDDFPD